MLQRTPARRQRVTSGDDAIGESDAGSSCRRLIEAEQGGAPFAAVLCDIEINDVRGTNILRVVRSTQQPPLFIFMTSHDRLEETAWLGDGVLIKPFRREEAVTTIARLMMKRSRAATRRMRAALPN